MKKYIVIAILSVCYGNLLSQNWILKNSNTLNDIIEINFTSELNGVFLTNNGELFNTTDGGEYWNLIAQDIDFKSVALSEDSIYCFNNINYSGPNRCIQSVSSTGDISFIKDTVNFNVTHPLFWQNEIWTVEKVNQLLNSLGQVESYKVQGNYISASNSTKLFYSNNYGIDWVEMQFTTSPLSSEPFYSFYNGLNFYLAITNYPTTIYSKENDDDWAFIQPDIGSNFNLVGKNMIFAYEPGYDMLFFNDTIDLSFNNLSMDHGINGLFFINDSLGFVYGENGMIYKTTNGGGLATSSNSLHEKKINVYPNPSRDILWIEAPEDFRFESIELYDINGRGVKQFDNDAKTLNIAGIPSGTYFLKIETNEGNITEKVLIQ